jgi:hypothetical protein
MPLSQPGKSTHTQYIPYLTHAHTRRRDAGCTQPLRLCSPATVERIRLACADPLITASRASINTTHERPWAIQP